MSEYEGIVRGAAAGDVSALFGGGALAAVVAQVLAGEAEPSRPTFAQVVADSAAGKNEAPSASDERFAALHQQAARSAALFRSAEIAAARREAEEAAAVPDPE